MMMTPTLQPTTPSDGGSAAAAVTQDGGSDVMHLVGPPMWETLHYAAFQCPEPFDERVSSALIGLVRGYVVLLPCAECRGHFAALLDAHPPEVAARSGRQAFARWTVDAHNAVNARSVSRSSPMTRRRDAMRAATSTVAIPVVNLAPLDARRRRPSPLPWYWPLWLWLLPYLPASGSICRLVTAPVDCRQIRRWRLHRQTRAHQHLVCPSGRAGDPQTPVRRLPQIFSLLCFLGGFSVSGPRAAIARRAAPKSHFVYKRQPLFRFFCCVFFPLNKTHRSCAAALRMAKKCGKQK
ncbi:Evr1/Alr family domain containing protein [Pandoravirus celtis]|uniref:Sulfhydryl oxidase n=1 Tax=Pandoravirus celtis TaxID=2568002 RepID=A0A4D6EGM5_9VIRU|nr:Evr1/Alr family domain containing protein [Pandoravirus celtis]